MQSLDRARTAAALPYSRLVPALAQAARELAAGAIRAPERQVVAIDAASVLLSMPAIGADLGVAKLITVHANNAAHGLPAIQGEVIVFDTASGRRLALLDGPTVTARRTAAMTLLGIATLAPQRPRSALLIGAGVQAAAHADALAEYFGIAQFWVAARDAAGAGEFCRALQERHAGAVARPLAAGTLARELPETDVVIALTTAQTPVIPAALAPHTLAVGVGAFKPDMAELPPALLHARQIVVDDLAGARHEAGDLIQARVDWSGVVALASVLSGAVRPTGVPVFKTVGQAAWDLAAARVAVGA
ncbi:delta(1)-pyrroline-2-carboxylate reductase family protein [Ralstonia sp. RL]|uniref:delta(1)-pyrroline-2-carboxylate reductase family protein n=1 Tax=Ralstonia sp. RL TaxID=1839756 RepID=UPI000AEBF47A|nr:delta(1)-pyrroline-2-carboxylate reductase family protein [Ralstonia sp. RL]